MRLYPLLGILLLAAAGCGEPLERLLFTTLRKRGVLQ